LSFSSQVGLRLRLAPQRRDADARGKAFDVLCNVAASSLEAQLCEEERRRRRKRRRRSGRGYGNVLALTGGEVEDKNTE
jgi:hypothetical protein